MLPAGMLPGECIDSVVESLERLENPPEGDLGLSLGVIPTISTGEFSEC